MPNQNMVITSNGIVRYQFFDGIDNEVVIIFVALLGIITLVLKIAYLQANNVLLGLNRNQRETIINERSATNLDLSKVRQLLSVPQCYSEEDCPICMDVVLCPAETNCRHVFCSKCLIMAWKTPEARGSGPTTLSPLSCPMCRQEVTMMVPKFTLMETPGLPPAGEEPVEDFDFESEKKIYI